MKKIKNRILKIIALFMSVTNRAMALSPIQEYYGAMNLVGATNSNTRSNNISNVIKDFFKKGGFFIIPIIILIIGLFIYLKKANKKEKIIMTAIILIIIVLFLVFVYVKKIY